MKKLFALLLCGLMLTGCTGKPEETRKPSQPPVIPETTLETQFLTTPATVDTEPVKVIQMTVYYPDENAINFLTTLVEGEQLTFMEAMMHVGVLNEEIQINSIIREENHITIDFNQAFKDLVCTMGTSGERMIIGSVVNTLIANYEVETVSITVDGEVWESGHVIYDFPMGFFE